MSNLDDIDDDDRPGGSSALRLAETGGDIDDDEITGDDGANEPEGSITPVIRRRRGRAKGPTRTVRQSLRDLDGDELATGSAEGRLRSRIDDDLEDFYSGLDFGSETHSVSVERLEPKRDEDGNDIGGHLDTFHEKMEVEDIKAKYGGGTYKITIRGPDPRTGRGSRIKGYKVKKIAGQPKIKKSAEANASKIDSIVSTLLDTKEKDLQRLAKESTESKNMLVAMLSKEDKTLPLIMKMMEESKNAMNPMMQQMMVMQQKQTEEDRRREDARREEERRTEAKRQEDERRREEKESKIREDISRREADARKVEQTENQRRHEAQMKQMEMNVLAAREQNNNMMQMMLGIFQGSSKQDKESQAMLFKMMSEGSNQALQQTQQMMQFQGNMFTSALNDAKEQSKQKSGFGEALENMAAMKDVMRMMNGQEEDTRPGWERAVDKLTEVMPSLGAAVSTVIASRAQNGSAQPGRRPTGPMIPGTVAVLDDDEEAALPPPATPNNGGQQTQKTVTLDPAVVTKDEQHTPGENDFKQVLLPPANATLPEQITYLIKDIDFAISDGWDAEKIFNGIVLKFPESLGDLLGSQTTDGLIDFINNNAPETWAITMPKGEEIMRETHEMLIEYRNNKAG